VSIHKDPRKTITFVQRFQDRNKLTRQEKIKLLGEIKKRDLMKPELLNMDRAWHLILRNWGLSNYPTRQAFSEGE